MQRDGFIEIPAGEGGRETQAQCVRLVFVGCHIAGQLGTILTQVSAHGTLEAVYDWEGVLAFWMGAKVQLVCSSNPHAPLPIPGEWFLRDALLGVHDTKGRRRRGW